MPYYTRPKHVVHFKHRDFEVDILKAFRGATHCDVDHKPRQTVCTACGERIEPQLVYLIKIDDVETDLECGSEEEACEFARAVIDDQIDDEGDEDDEDDTPTERPGVDGRNSDNGLIVPPPPAPGAPTGTPTNVVHQMKKLGWFDRALTIMRSAAKS